MIRSKPPIFKKFLGFKWLFSGVQPANRNSPLQYANEIEKKATIKI